MRASDVLKRTGYNPAEFISMRERHGAVKAMERLMRIGQIQSDLIRINQLGMAQDWSVEAGVLKFPDKFSPQAQVVARFRLDHIDDKELR